MSEGETAGAMTFRCEFSADDIRVQTYRGKLVKAKPQADTIKIAIRILEMDLDVLAVQEAEDIHIWANRHNESGQPSEFRLYDQI